ncbi:uncharacterized protein LOC111308053 [Durio zibethinus]|uniref:Uncharacterized protein LOC111308053 n=1 Tax=Durio zibethinus TaxID=66656 RepID=A0A6P6AB59_DURZI|nr:uncharacterized protein LOC111308053 [Durio zibethinus]
MLHGTKFTFDCVVKRSILQRLGCYFFHAFSCFQDMASVLSLMSMTIPPQQSYSIEGSNVNVHALLLLLTTLFRREQVMNYDQYSLVTEICIKQCLAAPRRAQYGGGIVVYPEFNQGAKAWTFSGEGAIREGVSADGNRFIVVQNRTDPLYSFSQAVQLENGNFYTFSAWIQTSEGSETVAVVFKTSDGKLIRGGETIAKQGCWSLLKGGIVAKFSSPVEILLEEKYITVLSKNTGVEIWVDSISLQPFTAKDWRSHQEKSIDKIRRRKVTFQVTYANKTAADGAVISIKQTASSFPFGCGMNHNILTSTGYQDWFASRFKVTSFTNEMKWYSTDKRQGEENYTIADAMPKWVKDLPPEELQKAATHRLNSVVSRYAGQLIGWDVMNENLHFSFFEDKLGENASSAFYSMAYHLDPKTTLFMNEYNTIEYSNDQASTASKYKKQLEEILSFPGNAGLKAAKGLEGHFSAGQPNLAYMRSSLDILGTMGLPIWLTEVDVGKGPYQLLHSLNELRQTQAQTCTTYSAQYLEDILREAFSHPAVEGIIIFGGPEFPDFMYDPGRYRFRIYSHWRGNKRNRTWYRVPSN